MPATRPERASPVTASIRHRQPYVASLPASRSTVWYCEPTYYTIWNWSSRKGSDRMGITRTTLIVGVFAVSSLWLLMSAPAAANTSGTMTVSTDTTLTEDHDGRIVIDADGVTLDCAGHTITGPGRLAGLTGIELFQRTAVTVQDCVLLDFNAGFDIGESDGNAFTNNSVSHVHHGFNLVGSDNNTLTGNSVTDATDWFGYGIFHGSDANELHANSATGVKGVGFIVWAASNNLLADNDASNNFGSGFGANETGTVGNTFSGNTANSNTLWGIEDVTPLFGGGTGDAGTDNNYSNNVCVLNRVGGSSPAGLCDVRGSFTDDDGSVFELDIEWMKSAGITKGCNPPVNDLFCPTNSVTRGQMAAFLVRALGLTARLDDPFTDDDNSIFEADIERIAAAGITRGCNPPDNDRFCPDGEVTRGAMAAFLVRALAYTDDGGGDLFVDDNASIFETDIDKLATAGVTRGCNPPMNDEFCPTSNVTRGQMAAFLHRALGA